MCVGNSRKETGYKNGEMQGGIDSISAGHTQDYSHMFVELESQLIIHRAWLMQRLVQDPFYRLMNISSAARLWMLRHLVHLAHHATHQYGVTLLRFFELMGREDVLKFMWRKNAPKEMILQWSQQYPPPPRVTRRKRRTRWCSKRRV